MIAVWFSCGAPSAVAAKLTVEKYGLSHEVRILNNPVSEEGDDNRRFLQDVAEWIGHPVEDVRHPKYPSASAEEVWDRNKAMAFPWGAPCTKFLKKEARQIWEQTNPVEWHVLGFTLEEKKRHERFVLTERSNVIPVLIEANLTRDACFDIIRDAGIELPEAYRLGYPNANCRGCVKANSPTYWNHVRVTDPDVFARRAEQSRRLGAKLTRVYDASLPGRDKRRRIYLDELSPSEQGKPMKQLKAPDCGTFCEEW